MKCNFIQSQKMSLKIIKAGLLDTIQDQGRYGFQHLGVNPSGAMDVFSSKLANSLLGNELLTPVIEMHFPAPEILFEEPVIICISGADFSPVINHHSIPINQPVLVNKNTLLQFERIKSGARSYLSILGGLTIEKWLEGYSTNLKAEAGGWKGRKLLRGDTLFFMKEFDYSPLLLNSDFFTLRWSAKGINKRPTNKLRFIKGHEWGWLEDEPEELLTENFCITKDSDRMAYRLKGKDVRARKEQLISSAVAFGTIQLLPNGQLIILMADHQTTGGYPRIGHIISADLPILAQMGPGDDLSFELVDLNTAEVEMREQANYLLHLQTICRSKIENLYATL